MTPREIKIANAEAAVTRWTAYTGAAIAAKDAKRAAYGELRLGSAERRLRKLLRP